jgi:hypothetical protein
VGKGKKHHEITNKVSLDWANGEEVMYRTAMPGDKLPPIQTTLQYILDDLVPEWEVLFARRNADYGDGAAVLGIRGQYSDMNRKMTKLKRSLWDGYQLTGEQPREILMDLIGHCFLTIDMLDTLPEPD